MEKKDIDALVRDSVREVSTIDYKELIGDLGKEGVKLDFLRDICSFANTRGGVIYFGISERRDANGKKTGEPDKALGLAGFNGEEEMSKINNIVSSRLEPRIVVDMEPVYGFPLGPVLVLRVPQSWTGPHMEGDDGRFYMRDSTGKKLMDYHTIRNSFIAFKAITEDVRTFHHERVKAILAASLFDSRSLLVLHAIPISSFVPAIRESIALPLLRQEANKLPFLGGISGRPNLDGLLFYHKSEMVGSAEYTQVFRSGIVERAVGGLTGEWEGVKVVYGEEIRRTLDSNIRGFLSLQRNLGLEAPIVVRLVLKGVEGHKLVSPKVIHPALLRGPVFFDRDELWFPEMICDDLNASLDPLIEELVTMLWQAGGFDQEL
jgi:hypothetical protein